MQFGENVRDQVGFICNCCGCCCEAMLAAKRFAVLNPIATTNFTCPRWRPRPATAAGSAWRPVPWRPWASSPPAIPTGPQRKKARLDASLCLGCGVCVRACAKGALALRPRGARVLTPVNTAHRAVLMAIERGKLQDLVFDNQAHWNHRAMAAILGVILKLPPLKQAMASRQMKSVYLDRLLARGTFVRREH